MAGLWLPDSFVEKEQQRITKAAYDAYYASHRFCPACGGDNVIQTLLGCIGIGPGLLPDTNSAGCEDCGWGGIVDELIG